MARELGLHQGTLGRWVNLDRRARDGEGPLSESERDELNRLRKETLSWRWSAMGSSARRPFGYPANRGWPSCAFMVSIVVVGCDIS